MMPTLCWICDFCSTGYTNKEDCELHEKTHSGIKIHPVYEVGSLMPIQVEVTYYEDDKPKETRIYLPEQPSQEPGSTQ